MMDLQFKNISRDLNYDVIIERTGEGILCQDNKQYDIHIRGKEYRMNKDYAQLYIDGMHRSGYNEGDNARRQFISFFTECLNNNDYKRITSNAGFDHELFCAAVAQLMTSGSWGCSNHGPYNIKEFFSLSKDQADFIIDNIPRRLSGLAKGAILASEHNE